MGKERLYVRSDYTRERKYEIQAQPNVQSGIKNPVAEWAMPEQRSCRISGDVCVADNEPLGAVRVATRGASRHASRDTLPPVSQCITRRDSGPALL